MIPPVVFHGAAHVLAELARTVQPCWRDAQRVIAESGMSPEDQADTLALLERFHDPRGSACPYCELSIGDKVTIRTTGHACDGMAGEVTGKYWMEGEMRYLVSIRSWGTFKYNRPDLELVTPF